MLILLGLGLTRRPIVAHNFRALGIGVFAKLLLGPLVGLLLASLFGLEHTARQGSVFGSLHARGSGNYGCCHRIPTGACSCDRHRFSRHGAESAYAHSIAGVFSEVAKCGIHAKL